MRGVRQGCLLAPCLFLIVVEALATVTDEDLSTWVRKILLPDGATQQVFSQFADNTTYSIMEIKLNLLALSNLLEEFGQQREVLFILAWPRHFTALAKELRLRDCSTQFTHKIAQDSN